MSNTEDSESDPEADRSADDSDDDFQDSDFAIDDDILFEPIAKGLQVSNPQPNLARSRTPEWQPLRDVDDIRVLTIEPSAIFNNDIECTTKITSLRNPCRYFALSHTWGATAADGSHLSKTIGCDSRALRVTAGLHRALQHLRARWSGEAAEKDGSNDRSFRIPAIWIDAICIDMDNVIERSRQVMLMGRIYHAAAHLIIWLSDLEEADIPKMALKDRALSRTSSADSAALSWSSDEQPAATIRTKRMETLDELTLGTLTRLSTGLGCSLDAATGMFFPHSSSLQSDYAQSTSKAVLAALQEWDWFGRRWVIQEASLQQYQTSILCGNWRIPVVNIVSLLSQRAVRLSSLGMHASKEAMPPLLLNLIRFSSSACTDDRDRVYSLLSISSDSAGIIVDYTRSVQEVYIACARHFIGAGMLEAVLFAATMPMSEVATTGRAVDALLPSWVPDWRCSLDLALVNVQALWKMFPAPTHRYMPSSSPAIKLCSNKSSLSSHRLQLSVRQIFKHVEDHTMEKECPACKFLSVAHVTRPLDIDVSVAPYAFLPQGKSVLILKAVDGLPTSPTRYRLCKMSYSMRDFPMKHAVWTIIEIE